MVLRPIGGKEINYRDEKTLYVLSGKGEPVYTPVRNRIKRQRPTKLAEQFTRAEGDQSRMCNWCPQVLGVDCGHKFLSDRRFIAHLLSKEVETEKHVILNEKEMAEKNRMLEDLKKEKELAEKKRMLEILKKEKTSASKPAPVAAGDLKHAMNQMKGEIMDKLDEIKANLKNISKSISKSEWTRGDS